MVLTCGLAVLFLGTAANIYAEEEYSQKVLPADNLPVDVRLAEPANLQLLPASVLKLDEKEERIIPQRFVTSRSALLTTFPPESILLSSFANQYSICIVQEEKAKDCWSTYRTLYWKRVRMRPKVALTFQPPPPLKWFKWSPIDLPFPKTRILETERIAEEALIQHPEFAQCTIDNLNTFKRM